MEGSPRGVKILDVRIPEEYIFVGHPEMAKNIPLLFVKYEWDAEKNQPVVSPESGLRPGRHESLRADRHAAADVSLGRA